MTTQEIVSRLSLEEKVSLLSGQSYWRTRSIPEHGVKAIKFSDGPNGVRGESIHASTKGYCFPCGACVGATFNNALIRGMGVALGRECKMKNAGVVLGPTINLHRSPLGGRNFESYSEDPTLSGILGAAYVNGVQSQNIAACPKHFVGNECEKYRKTSDTIVSEKTLRQLYAYAFQLTIKDSQPWCIMTSYNKVNGTWVSESTELLQNLLREEWKFKGLVMSDFEGVYTQNAPIVAGLDLEMPGPPLRRGQNIVKAVLDGEVSESQINILASRVVELASKIGMEDEGKPEQQSDDPVTAGLTRRIASEGIVLLKNENSILPLLPSKKPKIAVFGTPAREPIIHGGGSASMTPTYLRTPLDSIYEAYGKENVNYHAGVPIFKKIPSAPVALMTTEAGNPGVDCFWYNGSIFGENLVHQEVLETTRTLVIDSRIKSLQAEHCTQMKFILTPKTTGKHTFGVTSCGSTVLKVDGKEIVSHAGFPDVQVEHIMQPGNFENRAHIDMVAGHAYFVVIDTQSSKAKSPSPVFPLAPQATQVGFFENLQSSNGNNVKEAAESCDISIVFTGNNKEYESESFDRDALSLSPLQNELISNVANASKNTLVVNMTGSPISMPWLDQVDAVLQCWFAGQEVGNALIDLITGKVNPSGKLPVTFPVRLEDTPSYANFPTNEKHEIKYAEGLEMGYRARSAPAPLFPFGFGLSYTTFKAADLHIEGDGSCNATAYITISNTGIIEGQEVVQVYVDGVLKAFQKVSLQPQGSKIVQLELDKYSFSEWDEEKSHWVARSREYIVDVREHALSVKCQAAYSIQNDLVWHGL